MWENLSHYNVLLIGQRSQTLVSLKTNSMYIDDCHVLSTYLN